jgi:hypothetical protein
MKLFVVCRCQKKSYIKTILAPLTLLFLTFELFAEMGSPMGEKVSAA